MSEFADYATKYPILRMRREDGILELSLHTNGQSFQWKRDSAGLLAEAFLDVGRDRGNEVIILTGTGGEFSGPGRTPLEDKTAATKEGVDHETPASWDEVYWEHKQLLMNLLDIEVPMISAINGAAFRHAEIPLMCDIVIAAEHAQFRDTAHFPTGKIPGDGMHIVFPLLMGLNRARYFLLSGQTLDASLAQEYGLVNEVVPADRLSERAWTLARQIRIRAPLVRRYTRVLLVQDLKRRLHDLLGYGLALEGLPKMA